ncbi:MAG TPA: type VI secretion system contractile sheath large subunit [Thermoanaerobaculia bacterium]|jgi:type VI secretion system protein ImpC|nr:type VI secretion system contractile sheath large subunit [Thermoanaerobaculia bacterium]
MAPTAPTAPLESNVLRLLAVADLAPGRGIGGGGSGPLAVGGGAAGVDAALAELAPALAFAVPSHLGAGPREIQVACSFRALADFAPGALARAVPALAELLAAREDLPRSPGEAASPPPPTAATAGDPLAALLSQVELPPDSTTLSALPLAELLARPAAPERTAEIDRRLTRQVAEISAAPPLRALETAWRGVALLAARAADAADAGDAGNRSAVRLEILATDRESLLDTFYDQVFGDEHEGASAVALSAVVLGWELDRSPADVEDLRHLARMGESLRVPFLGAVGPAFWGIRQPGLLANLPDLVRKTEGSEYAKWNGLRREEVSLWLCLAANRLLLRGAWSEEGAVGPVARTGFEWRDPGPADRPLWGSGAWGLGAVLAQAFAAAGLRFPMTGPQPPAQLSFSGFSSLAPLEVPLADQKALEIARVGLAPLIARKGEAAAHFPSLPTVHLAKRYDREEATRQAASQATLPYQAFAGAAAHALDAIGREVPAGLAAEEVRQRFEAGLRAFLGVEAPAAETAATAAAGAADGGDIVSDVAAIEAVAAVEIEVAADPESPDVWAVHARLRPGFPISGSDVDLVLGSAVPR